MRPLIIDIETLPRDAEEHRAQIRQVEAAAPIDGVRLWPSAPWHAYNKIERSKLKTPEKAQAKDEENALKWWRSGSLKPHRARVYCLSYSTDGTAHTIAGTEEDIVDGFDQLLRDFRPSHVVAHNAAFERDQITAAAMRAGRVDLAGACIGPHYSFVAQMKLYGHRPQWLCTMKAWSEKPTKLEHVCEILGIDHSDPERNPITGADVLDAYMEGREEDIIRHCEADVVDLWKVFAVLRRMHGL